MWKNLFLEIVIISIIVFSCKDLSENTNSEIKNYYDYVRPCNNNEMNNSQAIKDVQSIDNWELEVYLESLDIELFYWIYNEDIESVKTYLMNGGNPELSGIIYNFNEPGDDREINALKIAVMTGSLDIVEILLSYGAQWPDERYLQIWLFENAVMTNNVELTMFILQNLSISENVLSRNLQEAVAFDNIEMIELLLDYGAIIEKGSLSWGNNPSIVSTAIERNNYEIFNYLLNNHIEDINLNYEFSNICYHGNMDFFERIILEDVDIDYNNDYPIIFSAASNGQYEIVLRLIDLGVEVDQQGKRGGWESLTALNEAVEKNHYCVSRLLLENNANPNNKGNFWPPLVYASINSNLDMVKLLIYYGSDINIVNEMDGNKYSPLHAASYSNSPEIIEVLLEHGADKELIDSRGRTPLDIAVEYKHYDCIILLE